MYFAISDLHFDHENIIKYCNRPFHNKHEMNECLIKNWNSIVSPDDIVYVVGDFSLGRYPEKISKFSFCLNGHKHLILGNHDKISPKDYIDCGFETVNQGFITLNVFDYKWVLCHFQMEEWEDSHKGSFHLFGHSHWNSQKAYSHAYFSQNHLSERKWNVCVEANNYSPINLEYLKTILEKRPTNFQGVD